jgi:hypothetical protein
MAGLDVHTATHWGGARTSKVAVRRTPPGGFTRTRAARHSTAAHRRVRTPSRRARTCGQRPDVICSGERARDHSGEYSGLEAGS